MGISYKIYELCNEKYFECTSDNNFYNFLNNSQNSENLIIRKGKKIYACYIIKRLSEIIDSNDENEWRDKILNNLGILDYFTKKSNQIEYNKDKGVSEAVLFVDKLNEILKME